MVLEGVMHNSLGFRAFGHFRDAALRSARGSALGLIVLAGVTLSMGACSKPAGCHDSHTRTEGHGSESAHRIIMHVYQGRANASDGEAVAFTWTTGSETGLATFQSGVLRRQIRFGEALVGANIDLPEGASAAIDIRVFSDRAGFASPWLRLAAWGEGVPPSHAAATREFADAASGLSGRVNVDCFESSCRFDAIEYRVTATTPESRVRRVSVVLTDTLGWVWREPAWRPMHPVTLDVPFRSQKTPKPELAGRLCSPTSVAMVLAYQGMDVPVIDVARRTYDAMEDLYGNWPHNVQAAHTLGRPASLARFDRWSEVERVLAAGQPIIASIRAGPGELRGAPYAKTDGHLIVLRGLNERGDVLVNDPSVSTAALGQLVYRREDLTIVWMHRTHGTAYLVMAHE